MSRFALQPLWRVLTWVCVVALALLSLLPAAQMMRTGIPGRLEHFIAYAGTSAVTIAGYGRSQGALPITGLLVAYAGLLEFLQNFSPGRHPAFADFLASALGVVCGTMAMALAVHVSAAGRIRTFRE